MPDRFWQLRERGEERGVKERADMLERERERKIVGVCAQFIHDLINLASIDNRTGLSLTYSPLGAG